MLLPFVLKIYTTEFAVPGGCEKERARRFTSGQSEQACLVYSSVWLLKISIGMVEPCLWTKKLRVGLPTGPTPPFLNRTSSRLKIICCPMDSKKSWAHPIEGFSRATSRCSTRGTAGHGHHSLRAQLIFAPSRFGCWSPSTRLSSWDDDDDDDHHVHKIGI